MGIPSWFIMCAGLLMFGSGALYFLRPAEGLYAVSLCMGGAVATAANMPDIMHRPGGMVFSSMTLAAALWASYTENGQLSEQACLICFACYVAGIAGRVFVPGSATLAKVFASKGEDQAAATTKAAAEAPKPASEQKDSAAKAATQPTESEPGSEKMPSKPPAA